MYTIVISDDEKGICEGLCSIISSSLPECEITMVFHDGSLLYEYLRSNEPDILLLDIEMPGRSGLEIARYVHEKSLGTQIIMITAHSKFEYARDAVNYHVNHFITKPFSSEELIHTLQALICTVAQKRSAANNSFHMRRSLICNCMNNAGGSSSAEGLLLCGGTVSIGSLQCTKTVFNNMEPGVLQTAPPECLAALRECAEDDSPEQTTFLSEAVSERLVFLTFHKCAPDLGFIAAVSKLLRSFGQTQVQHITKTFSSFELCRMERLFCEKMDSFWNNIAAEGPHQARNALASFLHSLSGERLEYFISFLNENYQVKAASPDADSILRELEPLIDQSLNLSSGMPVIKAAQNYIRQNFGSASLSRSAVAEHLRISDAHLSRLFTKHLGQTFSDYLLNVRMTQAKQLLKDTDLSTVAIAKSVGYYNPEYFRTAFKAYCGMTPRNFRMLQTGKE